jgi:CheY-like chemotaxis protein
VTTVLVVEDDEKSRRLVVDVLTSKGHTVVETERGEDAVDLALRHRPVVALLDIHLPGIDGVETLRRLRAQPETAAIAAVAVTASIMSQDRARIDAAGFDESLPKPISLKDLLALVERLGG